MTEQQHLDMILGKLEKEMKKLTQDMDSRDADISKLQELYWENYSDFDEYGYEEYENRQQMLNEVNAKSRNIKTYHMYSKMMDSPYFARIDFVFDGENEAEKCYIGIGNFADDKGMTPLIYDWRAPISSLFYDYDTGRASYEAPLGIIEGEITKKLQYKIKKGKLLYAVESNIKIDDDILKQALSLNADARLKNIVGTIQKEQNSIIRNEKDRILIVQGGAGSGKTSVALHRIAYLLYRNRDKIKASQVLILSPNDVFADYISHILPELGEENISETTFDDFAVKELRNIAAIEGHYDFLEDVLKNEDSEKSKIRQEKLSYRGSKAFAEEINAYVFSLEYDLIDFKDIKYKKLFKDADSIAELFYNKLPDLPLFMRMEAVCEYVVDEYTTLTGHELDEIEMGIVSDKFMSLYKTRDILSIYNDFLLSIGEEGVDLNTRHIGYEDVYALLYMKYLLCGTRGGKKIKHLIIDEMQDYSYMQYCIIGWVFKCPMTILGDKEQSVDTQKSGVLDFLPGILGKDSKTIVLNKSYRSTVEITDCAARIAGIERECGIDRHGKEPGNNVYENEDKMLDALNKAVSEELSTGEYETIAVLCKTQKEAEYFGDKLRTIINENNVVINDKVALNDNVAINDNDAVLNESASETARIDVTIINKNTDRFKPGVVVMPFYLAKGLEFDSVHVLNVDDRHYFSDYHRQILYISATRALHKLNFYGVGGKCKLL